MYTVYIYVYSIYEYTVYRKNVIFSNTCRLMFLFFICLCVTPQWPLLPSLKRICLFPWLCPSSSQAWKFRVKPTIAEQKADTHTGLLSSQGHTHTHRYATSEKENNYNGQFTQNRQGWWPSHRCMHARTHTHADVRVHAHTQLCLRAKVLAMHHYPPLEVIPYPSMHFSCGEEITPGPCWEPIEYVLLSVSLTLPSFLFL